LLPLECSIIDKIPRIRKPGYNNQSTPLSQTRLLPEDVKEHAEYGVFFALIFNVVCSTP
jgi:hypothetical protein